METLTTGPLSKAGSVHRVEKGYVGLPSMNEPGTISAIGGSLHNPEGVLFSPKGTTVKFETPDYAIGFFNGDRTFAP